MHKNQKVPLRKVYTSAEDFGNLKFCLNGEQPLLPYQGETQRQSLALPGMKRGELFILWPGWQPKITVRNESCKPEKNPLSKISWLQ